MKYLQFVCGNSEVANVVVNSPILAVLTKLLKASADLHREQAASVVGILMRNATMISEEVEMTEVVTTLADVLRDQFRNVQLKRRLVSTLGEALFYVASQAASDETGNYARWKVPGAVYAMLRRCIRPEEDPVVCHYAIKAVENVSHIDGDHAVSMATHEMVMLLWTVFSHEKDTHMRKACSWAISRLAEVSESVFQHIVDKAGVANVLDALQDPNLRVRQAFVNALFGVFGTGSGLPRLQAKILEVPDLLPRIHAAMEGAASTLRAKCYLLIALISEVQNNLLTKALTPKLVHMLERDARRREDPDAPDDTYLFECGGCLIRTIVETVPHLLVPLNEILIAVHGRKRPSVAQTKALRTHAGNYPAALASVRSWVTHAKVCQDSGFCDTMASILKHLVPIIDQQTDLLDVSPTAADDLINTSIGIVEVFSHNARSQSAVWHDALQELLPVVATLLGVTPVAIRLSCLQVISKVVFAMLSPPGIDGRTDIVLSDSWLPDVRTFLEAHVLKRCAELLQAADPIPVCVVRLLGRMVERDDGFVKSLLAEGLGPGIVRQLQPNKAASHELQTGSSDPEELDSELVVTLLRDIATSSFAPPLRVYELCENGLCWRASRALEIAVKSGESAAALIQPLLQIIHATLRCSLLLSATSTAAVAGGGNAGRTDSGTGHVRVEQCRATTASALNNATTMIDLMLRTEADEVVLFAAECLTAVFKLHPGKCNMLMTKSNMAKMGTMLVHGGEAVKCQVLRLVKHAVLEVSELKAHVRRHLVLSQAILSATASGANAAEQQCHPTSASASQAPLSAVSSDVLAVSLAQECGMRLV